jgi:hypothetical protein
MDVGYFSVKLSLGRKLIDERVSYLPLSLLDAPATFSFSCIAWILYCLDLQHRVVVRQSSRVFVVP